MIKIHIKTNNDAINYIKIKGHSGYAESGYDIVCASVSSICVTTINAIVRYNEKALVYTEDPNNPGNFIIEKQPAYTEYISESLKEANWQSFGLHIGLKYSF